MLGVFAIFLLNKDIKTSVYAKDWFAHRKTKKTKNLSQICGQML